MILIHCSLENIQPLFHECRSKHLKVFSFDSIVSSGSQWHLWDIFSKVKYFIGILSVHDKHLLAKSKIDEFAMWVYFSCLWLLKNKQAAWFCLFACCESAKAAGIAPLISQIKSKRQSAVPVFVSAQHSLWNCSKVLSLLFWEGSCHGRGGGGGLGEGPAIITLKPCTIVTKGRMTRILTVALAKGMIRLFEIVPGTSLCSLWIFH